VLTGVGVEKVAVIRAGGPHLRRESNSLRRSLSTQKQLGVPPLLSLFEKWAGHSADTEKVFFNRHQMVRLNKTGTDAMFPGYCLKIPNSDEREYQDLRRPFGVACLLSTEGWMD
jgi:hypothetical protein